MNTLPIAPFLEEHTSTEGPESSIAETEIETDTDSISDLELEPTVPYSSTANAAELPGLRNFQFRTVNQQIAGPRARRHRPTPLRHLSRNRSAQLSPEASTYPHSVLHGPPGPPPSGPLPALPAPSPQFILQGILEESEEQVFDSEILEQYQAIADIQEVAVREAFEAEHQRRLRAPAQIFSNPLELSPHLIIATSTPPLTFSPSSTGDTSDFERTFSRNFFGGFRSPSPLSSSTDLNMEVTEIVNNTNNVAGNPTQHEVEPEVPEVPEVPEAPIARLGGYTSQELLQLRYVGNRPLDQLSFTEGAPIDLIVRTTLLPDYSTVAMSSHGPSLEAKNRDPWMSDDDEVVFQGGAPVTTARRPATGSDPQEPMLASRQPFNPPKGDALQAIEGFARFLKEHASPTHKRVTAGGRIVSAGPNSPPPTFNMGFIDGVLQQINQSQLLQEYMEKQARDAEEEDRQKAIENSGAPGADLGSTPNDSDNLAVGNADGTISTSEVALKDQPEQNQVAAGGTLTLPPGSQPMLMAGDGTTIFQMGGSMFRAVLHGSETLYELLTPVQPVGHDPLGSEINRPLPQQMMIPMPVVASTTMTQGPSFTPLQPMFNMQTTNPMHTMDSVQASGSVQSTLQIPAMQQFAHGITTEVMRPALPSDTFAAAQYMVPEHGYGHNLQNSSYFPSGHSFVQDNRHHGHGIATMDLQPYNVESGAHLSGQPSLQVQLRNVESRMKNLMNHKSELEQQWALKEWQMSPMERTSNRDQLRRCTLQHDDLRKMKKTLESSIGSSSDGRIGHASSGNPLSIMTRPAPQGYAYNGRDSMRASFASTISNDTFNGEAGNVFQGSTGNRGSQTSIAQSFSGHMTTGMTHSIGERNSSKPLSPNAPAFVPGGMAFSTPPKPQTRPQSRPQVRPQIRPQVRPQVRPQDPSGRGRKSHETSTFDSSSKHQFIMSGVDWPTVIIVNQPAGEIDEADIKYCDEAGFNDPGKPKKYCTTILEITWVIKNVRQQAKLFGCKNGSSKDPEWDAEQDVRHAIHVLRRPIPLAPMLPDFVHRMGPWNWEDSIFNVGQGMSPYWVAQQHHRPPGVVQVEAQVDQWSHERLVVLERKLSRNQDVSHGNRRTLNGLAHRELSFTASSRKRSESIVSWDSDLARAADEVLESAKKSEKQTLKPVSQLTATPHNALDESVFDLQAYRREQSGISHLTSEHLMDSQTQIPARSELHERRHAKQSNEQSNTNESLWDSQVKTVPVNGPTSENQSNTLLRSMLDLKIQEWEPLPGETQEEFEKAYFARKHIFDLAKASSNRDRDLEFPPMKQLTSKENRPFHDQQSLGNSNENVPRLRRTDHKAPSSMASPVFHAQGIVPSLTGTSSVPAYMPSNPSRQRQQEQVTGFGSNRPRGFGESSVSRPTAATESPSPRNWQAPHPTGHHARTRPGDYSSQHRNPSGHGHSHYYQPPHLRRGGS